MYLSILAQIALSQQAQKSLPPLDAEDFRIWMKRKALAKHALSCI